MILMQTAGGGGANKVYGEENGQQGWTNHNVRISRNIKRKVQ